MHTPNQGDHLIGNNTWLFLNCKILKGDSSDLDRRVSRVSSPAAFRSSQLNVVPDNHLITSCNNYRSYRASIQFVLSYGDYTSWRRNFSRDIINKHEEIEQERENVGL